MIGQQLFKIFLYKVTNEEVVVRNGVCSVPSSFYIICKSYSEKDLNVPQATPPQTPSISETLPTNNLAHAPGEPEIQIISFASRNYRKASVKPINLPSPSKTENVAPLNFEDEETIEEWFVFDEEDVIF